MDISLLRKYGTVKTYDNGETICTEGELGSTAFLLLEGWAKVTKESDVNGAVDVGELQPGAIFGEMSLLENKARVASVTADKYNTKVLEIGKDHFLDLIKAEPGLGYELLMTMLERVDDTLEQIVKNKTAKNIAFVAEVRRDKNYLLLQRLSEEQFTDIVKKDSDHALTLLKFLSHVLAEVDQNV